MKDILICDDHPICQVGLAHSLRLIFEEPPEIRTVSNVKSAIENIRHKNPDFVFLDLGLPDGSGVQIIPEIRKISPKTDIVVVTGSDNPGLLLQALGCEIKALVSKSLSHEQLKVVLNQLKSRKQESPVVDSAIQSLLPSTESEELTPREWDVIALIAEGLTNRDIAEKLNCSIETIKTHRSNLGQKISARNRAELTAWYLQRKKNFYPGTNS